MNCHRGTYRIILFLIAALSAVSAVARFRVSLPQGWFPAGSHPDEYQMELDSNIHHNGIGSGHIRSIVTTTRGFGTLMQMCSASTFRGKRIRLSAYVKAANVNNWAGVWMRVDGDNGTVLSFDNMKDRPISGTLDWRRYDVVLDVPGESRNLAYGILLYGTGEIWIDDMTFEEVGTEIPSTDGSQLQPRTAFPENPVNISFEGDKQ